jgi:membrane associated rhomboid family serine protease
MTTKEQLLYKYRTANMLEKLIGVNVLMFILTYVFKAVFFLMGSTQNPFFEWLALPSQFSEFIFQPWSIFTYAFLHGGFFHILFNLIILHFGGQLFLNFYSSKRLLNYYLLGAIVGGLFFMLSYNLFPVFSNSSNIPLVGASAGVMSVFIGITTKAPNMQVRLFFLGNLKLWWIAGFFLIMDIVQLSVSNSGGHISHLGGALIGYLYTTQLNKGNDIGKWIENLIIGFQQLFSSKTKSKSQSKSKMKTVFKNESYTKSSKVDKTEKQKRIDTILDKISKSGYDSLSKEEKDFLFNAGKDI